MSGRELEKEKEKKRGRKLGLNINKIYPLQSILEI